ncbi:MAG: methylated-DNA--[protein]-cysteine S-methyltransferase [Kibdelosporangium sp.]
MSTVSSTVDTPIGPFTAVVGQDGAVLASGWTGDVNELVPLIHPSLRPASVAERPELGKITDAIRSYHAGDLQAIDAIDVNQRSGEFTQNAWRMLRTIPAGKRASYALLARITGHPDAIRAAATACARNPVTLFVPCHRVVRSDGTIGGFRWGLEAKRWLLDLENCQTPALP